MPLPPYTVAVDELAVALSYLSQQQQEESKGNTAAAANQSISSQPKQIIETQTMTSGEAEAVARVSDLSPESIGKTVKLHGWVYSSRTQGAGSLLFVDLGDGTTVTPCRCIAENGDAPSPAEGEEPPKPAHPYGSFDNKLDESESDYKVLTFDEMTQASFLSIGCSVQIIGYVAQPPEGTTQSFEVKILRLAVIGGVKDPSKYPIQKSILKKPMALRAHHHARFRAPLIQQLMQIRSQALFAVHEFFHKEGVPLLDPNIMTSSDCEGAGEVFKISPQMFSSAHAAAEGQEDKKQSSNETGDALPEVGLTVSSQLPLEAISMGTKAVYTCQKSFRAEKSDTNKHLAEFLHIEYEEYFLTLETLMDQAERYVKTVIKTVLDRCMEQYKFLNGRATAPPEFHGHKEYLASLLDKPFVRIKHSDAIDMMLQDLRDKVKTVNDQGKEVKLKFKVKPAQGDDLGSEHEKYLVKKFGTFVFVTHWPSAIKSFYMKRIGEDGTYCESFDLLAPLVGELFGGSMREWRYDVLSKAMEAKDMDFTPLQWYVDLRHDGTAPHGGWGMGFDRLVMLLTNASSVRDIVPYPVYYTHCPY